MTNERITAMIVDDEAPAREELIWLLEQVDFRCDIDVLAQCASAREVMRWLEEHEEEGACVDVVFLDINMPGVDGVRLAELLRDHEQVGAVVFVTAYDHHAVDAFEVDATDYLLKPIRMERLQRALHKVHTRIEATRALADVAKRASARALTAPEEPSRPASIAAQGSVDAPSSGPPQRYLDRISVEERGVYRVIPIEDILFFESEDGVVVVQTRAGRYMTDFSLKFLEQNLQPEDFFRSHRSYIVKLDQIDSIAPWGAGTYRLVMDREADLGVPLARSRAAELKSLIPWSASVFEDP